MPDEQDAPLPRRDALEHVMKNLFDSELERLAFARPQTEADREKSAAAARELDRRAADHAARSGETPATPEPTYSPTLAVADRARGPRDGRPGGVHNGRPGGVTDARPGWLRPVAVLGAGILALIVVTSIAPMLPTEPGTASSLDVFATEPTADELALQRQLAREGLRLSVAPRVIARRDEGAQVLAYRLIVTSGAERPRNEVCLLLDDVTTLGAPVCVDRVDFLRDGMLASLAGPSTTYVVQWGPTGPADVSVLPQNQVALPYPQSAAAEEFFTGEQTSDSLVYQGLLRSLHPDDRLVARVLATTPAWDAVGTLVASADTGLWSYCVHLFTRADEPRPQLGARVTCAALETFERQGLVAQARTGESTVQVEWRADGDVMATETGL